MIEGIDIEKVTAWFRQAVPDLKEPMSFSLIAGGHSNLTFRCTDANGRDFVLRRPPLGHVIESAHDVAREHRIVSALQDSGIPVPTTIGVCTDDEVNKAPFYVMDHVGGLVLHDSIVGQEVANEDRRAIGLHVMEVLSNLHQINPDDFGLGQLGRKEAYLSRQLNRWNKQWVATKTHPVPEMEESSKLLEAQMPEQVGATIVHGDYRLGNMIVQGPRIKAVLDWELCTLGDPLADVGYLLNNWVAPGEKESSEGDQGPTLVGGYPDRDELCSIYANNTGRDLADINYYRAFSHWRLAAIGQGVYKRYLVGAMGEGREMDLESYKESIVTRATQALELLSA
jgi:aminoglycoside phosphotransferase (APT) family kinase protein